MKYESNEEKLEQFKHELQKLINRYSLENRSNTHDFVLAEYLVECLLAYEKVIRFRDGYKEDVKTVLDKVDPVEKDTGCSFFVCKEQVLKELENFKKGGRSTFGAIIIEAYIKGLEK